MAGILCDQGIAALNVLLTNAMVSAGYLVGLYTNNYTPTLGDTLASYTEAAFGGYARQPLLSPTPGGVTADIDTQTFAAVVFTPSGSGLPVTCYGYFITDGTVLIGAEKFPVALTLTTAGIPAIVIPSQTYQDRSVA